MYVACLSIVDEILQVLYLGIIPVTVAIILGSSASSFCQRRRDKKAIQKGIVTVQTRNELRYSVQLKFLVFFLVKRMRKI